FRPAMEHHGCRPARSSQKKDRRRLMDFQFTHGQRLWSDTVHSFMEKEVGRDYTREHDANREFPEEVFRKMAGLGWLGLLVDEQDGGRAAVPIMFAFFWGGFAKFSLDTPPCIMT